MAMEKRKLRMKASLLKSRSKPKWKKPLFDEEDEGKAVTKKQWMELSPLSKAAYQGDVKKIKELLKEGANPDVRDSKKRTPLIWAAIGNQPKAAKALLEGGASLEKIDAYGKGAFDYADDSVKEVLIDYDIIFE
ncbi:MAG: ankyrin repeat domain-containing protein [Candidatus Anstonellales archaeon]